MTAFEEISIGISNIQNVSANKGKADLKATLTNRITKLIKTSYNVGSRDEMKANAEYNKAIRDVLEVIKEC